MCSADQDKKTEKAWPGQDTERGTEEEEGAKWSGARTLRQEGNDYPQRGSRACTVSIPSPQQKRKSIFVGSLQVFLCMASHYEINLLHSDKHDRATAIPVQVLPALAS